MTAMVECEMTLVNLTCGLAVLWPLARELAR